MVGTGAPLSEVLAVRAIPYVERQADDRVKHRVRAVQQGAVLDRMHTDVDRDLEGAPTIPAPPVAVFGFHRGQY